MLRRLTALAVLVALVALAAPAVAQQALVSACPADLIGEDGFVDVGAGTAHEAAVDCLVHWQVARGVAPRRYGPATSVTRAQTASMLARLLERSGATLPPAGAAFGDLAGNVHRTAIETLAAAGIIAGRGPGRFDPEAAVTRAEMATLLVRSYEWRAGDELGAAEVGFPGDDPVTYGPHAGAIAKAVAAGFVVGTASGSFEPETPVRRDQMASFLARLLDRLVAEGRATVPPPPPPVFDAARPFAPDSAWNTPIPPTPVVDDRSPGIVASLSRAGRGYANLYEFGIPIYEADAGTPRHTVTCTEDWGTCDLERQPVPIPDGARPHTGSDGAMVVVDRAGGRAYEFWQVRLEAAGWVASWGAVSDLAGPGNGVGSTGAGVSRLAGVVRTAEIAAGAIEHALVFSTDNACAGELRYPATKTDGHSTAPDCIPEGARVQLDPGIDLAAIPGITPGELAVGRALQIYGAYAMDNGGAPMAFSFEVPQGHDPYPASGLAWDYHGMESLPWARLRVLRSHTGA